MDPLRGPYAKHGPGIIAPRGPSKDQYAKFLHEYHSFRRLLDIKSGITGPTSSMVHIVRKG